MKLAFFWLLVSFLWTLTAGGKGDSSGTTSDKIDSETVSIEIWSAASGTAGELLQKFADTFNAEHSDYQINVVYKGGYVETMSSGIAAYRAGSPPQVLQVFEVGTETMIKSGAIEPVSELLASVGIEVEQLGLLPVVKGYYSGADGLLYSMPFNSSTPVLFFNKDMFRQAGLDVNKPPATWEEVQIAAKKIVMSGAALAGFTVSWPSWTLIENFAAWHGLPFASNNNGLDGNNEQLKLTVNHPIFAKMLDSLAAWSTDKTFIYGGRQNSSESLFAGQQVAMIITSSAAYNSYQSAGFDLGISAMPYWGDMNSAPQNTIIGGASFWVFKGASAAEKKGMAEFFSFLVSEEVQIEWHQTTGYVPVVMGAYEALSQTNFYQRNPGMEVAIEQLNYRPPLPFTRGVRIGRLPQIRLIFYGELEAVLQGEKDGATALADYQKEGQKVIDKFVRGNR